MRNKYGDGFDFSQLVISFFCGKCLSNSPFLVPTVL